MSLAALHSIMGSLKSLPSRLYPSILPTLCSCLPHAQALLTCSGLPDGMGTPLAASRSSSMAGCMACACTAVMGTHPRHSKPNQMGWDESSGSRAVFDSCRTLFPCVGSRRPADFSSPPGTAPTRCTGPSSWPAAPRRSPAPWWRRFAGLCVRCDRGCSGPCDERAER